MGSLGGGTCDLARQAAEHRKAGLPLSDADGATGVHDIEHVRQLQQVVVRRHRQPLCKQPSGLLQQSSQTISPQIELQPRCTVSHMLMP